MKNLSFVPYMLTIMLLGSVAATQTGDWQAVKALPPETRIRIALKQGLGIDHCIFKQSTDSVLTCAFERQGLVELRVRRDDVRAVFLSPEHHHAASLPVPAVAAAVLGPVVIIGVFAGPVPLLIGAGVLGGTCLAARHSSHGKIIYRSPRHPSPHQSRALSAGEEPQTLLVHPRE
jgi:hypothetical protein